MGGAAEGSEARQRQGKADGRLKQVALIALARLCRPVACKCNCRGACLKRGEGVMGVDGG